MCIYSSRFASPITLCKRFLNTHCLHICAFSFFATPLILLLICWSKFCISSVFLYASPCLSKTYHFAQHHCNSLSPLLYGFSIKSMLDIKKLKNQMNVSNQMSGLLIFRKRKRVIPYYLYKIKIKSVRTKIVLRKYAYLFYRKTISNILLSTAEKHYKTRIIKKCFIKLRNHWYEERVQWRLVLRANLHYKNFLKMKCFDCWRCFMLQNRQKKVTIQIVNLYYVYKLKSSCFKHITNLPKINKKERLVSDCIQTYSIFLFLYLNTLNLLRSCFNLELNIICGQLGKQAFKKRNLLRHFQHWKIFTEKQKLKKFNEYLTTQFRKLKYNPKLKRQAFNRWILFTHRSIEEKLTLKRVDDFVREKLKRKYLSTLQKYVAKKACNRWKTYSANLSFQRCLLRKVIKTLVNYKNYKFKRYEQINTTEEFYRLKLRRSSLQKLKKYQFLQTKKREAIEFAKMHETNKIKRHFFNKLRRYQKYRHEKNQKYFTVSEFCVRKMLRKYFDKIRNYHVKRKKKESARLLLINRAISMRNKRLVKRIFQEWISYMFNRRKNKIKIFEATRTYEYALLHKNFRQWKKFIEARKLFLKRLELANSYYNKVLVRHTFDKLKLFIKELHLCRSYLLQAEEVYRNHLLKSGVRMILTSSFSLREARQKMAFVKYYNAYLLALKYFKKWKYKTYRVGLTVPYQTLLFQWNPICCEQPSFLRSLIND